MSDEVWFLLTVAMGVAMSLMFAVWILARWLNNAGVVDVMWAFGFAIIALIFLVIGEGDPLRKGLIAGMVIGSNLRLGVYLWMRVAKHHPEEDGRYATLRAQFPNHTWLMFLGFFELQAVLQTVLSVPFAMAASNPVGTIQSIEWAAVGLWVIAMVGEGVADWQLNAFRSRSENKGRTCKVGLWRFSRHPNYFFEWLTWVSFFLFALGSPHGWITLYCPALMLFFLFKVTGIPATEEQAVKSRGDEYREYQRTTSVFVPWFPK